MIEYRRLDFSKDVDEVVSLIKRNLNPNYSEDILRWKHLKSPFGPSVGLIAIEDEKIVGVVFAASYVFQNCNSNKLRSIRFFDACTEPDQRGKGIFKTLMKMAFDIYQGEIDFSFSNPNIASLKGHLGVGYEEPEVKTFYRLGLLQPKFGNTPGVFKNFKPNILNGNPITTADLYFAGNSLNFLNWRYREDRYIISEFRESEASPGNYIVHRIERRNGLKIIVLCDYFGEINLLQKALNKVCRLEKTYFIYYLENQLNNKLDFFFTKKNKRAVIVFKSYLNQLPKNIVITLGDLEGRL